MAGTAQAIQRLQDATETLDKREQHLQRKMDNEIKQARIFSNQGKKREALTCIKRKKLYEKQMEMICNQKTTLETQRLALEQMNINREAFEAQQVATSALKQATASMGGVEAVEEGMDNLQENLQDAEEIQQALATPLDGNNVEDDDDLLAELEGLEQEGLDEALSKVDIGAEREFVAPTAPSQPLATKVPTHQPQMTEEERELAELEASMTM